MKTIITLLALAGLALAPITSNAQTDKKWSVDVSLNALAAGLSGDVTVKGIPANLDVGFDQVLEHLNAGAMGAVRVGYDRWAINTEFIYMDLGGSQGGARVDFEQLTVEPTLRYRVCDYFEALAGARYNNLSGSVSLTGPLGTQRASSGTVDWWDPIVGGIVRVPISRKFSVNVHGDIGGFDVGSDLTWQAFPYLNWQISRRCSVQAGYRWIFNDYSQGSGRSKFRYDVLAQGPQLGITLHF
jgi:hypothetical protein